MDQSQGFGTLRSFVSFFHSNPNRLVLLNSSPFSMVDDEVQRAQTRAISRLGGAVLWGCGGWVKPLQKIPRHDMYIVGVS